MGIHEYQAKGIFKEYGLLIPEGGVATTPAKVEEKFVPLGRTDEG